MNRRRALQALAGGAAVICAQNVFSQSSPDIVVVQVANFMCSNSRQVNLQYDRILAACNYAGVGFRFAPVTWQDQSEWPARIYYAVRNLYPKAESVLRDALFDGMQRKGLAFETVSQVMAHLTNNQLDVAATKLEPSFNLATIVQASAKEDIEVSMLRAIRLTALSEVEMLPSFLWIQGGEIIKVLDGNAAPSPANLASLFVKTVTTPPEVKK